MADTENKILDDAQYHNFFRNLAEIVHADLPTVQDKRQALLTLIRTHDKDDLTNLEEFVSWFDGYDF